MYDTIVVGMGIAGITSAIYAKRGGLNTLMIESEYPGGLLNKISVIENYPGIKSITGMDLSSNLLHQVKENDIPYKIEKVVSIENNGEFKRVITTKDTYDTKSIVIAIGRKPRKSNLLNEEKYIGKGVSYCAVCDAPLYKNKNVLVLGGGNSAFEEALYLSDIVNSIKIIIRSNIKAENNLVERVKSKDNIEIIENTNIKEIIGDEIVKGIKLDNDDIINCDGIFIYYGYEAETSFIKHLNITDENGYIVVDNNMMTNVESIYACGDIIKKDLYQLITAASEGALAATNIIKNIKNK